MLNIKSLVPGIPPVLPMAISGKLEEGVVASGTGQEDPAKTEFGLALGLAMQGNDAVRTPLPIAPSPARAADAAAGDAPVPETASNLEGGLSEAAEAMIAAYPSDVATQPTTPGVATWNAPWTPIQQATGTGASVRAQTKTSDAQGVDSPPGVRASVKVAPVAVAPSLVTPRIEVPASGRTASIEVPPEGVASLAWEPVEVETGAPASAPRATDAAETPVVGASRPTDTAAPVPIESGKESARPMPSRSASAAEAAAPAAKASTYLPLLIGMAVTRIAAAMDAVASSPVAGAGAPPASAEPAGLPTGLRGQVVTDWALVDEAGVRAAFAKGMSLPSGTRILEVAGRPPAGEVHPSSSQARVAESTPNRPAGPAPSGTAPIADEPTPAPPPPPTVALTPRDLKAPLGHVPRMTSDVPTATRDADAPADPGARKAPVPVSGERDGVRETGTIATAASLRPDDERGTAARPNIARDAGVTAPASAHASGASKPDVMGAPAPARPAHAQSAVPTASAEPMTRPAHPAGQVTVQFQGENGTEGQLRVTIRGGALRATIQTADSETAQQLSNEIAEIQRALSTKGFVDAQVVIQQTRTVEDTQASQRQQGSQDPSQQERDRERRALGRERGDAEPRQRDRGQDAHRRREER